MLFMIIYKYHFLEGKLWGLQPPVNFKKNGNKCNDTMQCIGGKEKNIKRNSDIHVTYVFAFRIKRE